MNDDARPSTEPLDESTPPPTALDLDRTEDLTATWPDGVTTRYSLEELRVNCPCAECRGLRERGLPVWPKPTSPLPPRPADAGSAGGGGINFPWTAGHPTATFPWPPSRRGPHPAA